MRRGDGGRGNGGNWGGSHGFQKQVPKRLVKATPAISVSEPLQLAVVFLASKSWKVGQVNVTKNTQIF